LVDLFGKANLCAIHAKRVTISKLALNEHFSFTVFFKGKHARVLKTFQLQGHLCFLFFVMSSFDVIEVAKIVVVNDTKTYSYQISADPRIFCSR
jgi:hypothetical protein